MRGVGQTTNLIYNLPNERCVLVTHTPAFKRIVEKRIKELRGDNFAKLVKIVSISDLDETYKIIGMSHLVFFDHAFFDSVEESVAKRALEYAQGAAIVYHTHKGNFK